VHKGTEKLIPRRISHYIGIYIGLIHTRTACPLLSLTNAIGLRCAVFDVDNTLLDSRERFNLVARKFGVRSPKELTFELQKEFWRSYMDPALLSLDKPIARAVEMAVAAKRMGLKVVIVTGRYEWLRADTAAQLSSAGVPFDAMLMRPDGNYQEDRDLKPFLIRSSGCHVVEYHDDDLDSLLEVGRIFPDARLFLHRPDGTFDIIQ